MRHLLVILFLAALHPQLVMGASPAAFDAVQAELISEMDHVQPGKPFWVALRLQIKYGWHTYWKNPGDSGAPTTIAWTLPPGFEAGAIQWPRPQRIDEPPLASYGYEREVLLLTQITPASNVEAGTTVEIRAVAKWLMCHDVCIPGSAELNLSLAINSEPLRENLAWAMSFADTMALLPETNPAWTFKAATDRQFVELIVTPPTSFGNEIPGAAFFPYNKELIDHAAEQKWKRAGNAYRLMMKRSEYNKVMPDHVDGVMILDGEPKPIEVNASWIEP